MLTWLTKYVQQPLHRVIGLMSGTSVDGIDVAWTDIQGSGEGLRAELRGFVTVPFPDSVRQRVLRLSQNGSVEEATRLNIELGELFAAAALQLIREAGMQPGDFDLIG